MGRQYSVTSGAVSLSATTAKTLFYIDVLSTSDLILCAADIGMDGSATGNNAKVDLYSLSANTTVAGTAYTPLKYGAAANALVSLQTSTQVKSPLTAEGTATYTIISSWYVPLNSGQMYLWPLGREFYLAASGHYGIRVTAPSAVSAICNVVFEE